ncbi:MAG: SNF2 helicase associated domain-containing protein [Eubacteriales bacterium]|nr:SNF2 helicase associated domain-containing protein [Eubacteriales bacterium]
MSRNNWRELFSKTMLANGEQYYKSGKAKRLQEEDEGFSATVRGTRNYRVRIETRWDDGCEILTDMSCTCPHARDGNVCKHMAAVLFLIEKEFYPLIVDEEYERRISSSVPLTKGQQEGRRKGTGGAGKGAQGSKGGSGKDRGTGAVREPEDLSAIPENMGWAGDILALQRQELAQRRKEQEDEKTSAAPPRHMEPYRYFQYEKFERNLKIEPAARQKAKKLLNADALKGVEVKVGYATRNPWDNRDAPTAMHGFASARFDNGYESVRIVFDAENVVEANCSYWKCRRGFFDQRIGEPIKVCEHELALLSLACEYLEKNNPGDATSIGGSNLLNLAGRGAAAVPGAGQGQYQLADADAFSAPALQMQPVVNWEEDGENSIPTVFFRVGTSRLYKIKKIGEFVNAMKAGEEMKFGTKTMIRLGEALLEKEAAPWYRFMQDALREEQLRNRALSVNIAGNSSYYSGSGYEVGAQITDAVPLYGAALDRFYREAQGKRIEFSIKSFVTEYGMRSSERRKAELLFCDHELDVQIEVAPFFGMQMMEEADGKTGPRRSGRNTSGASGAYGASAASGAAAGRDPGGADSAGTGSGGAQGSGAGGFEDPSAYGSLQGIRITGELPPLIEGQDASYFVDEKNGRFCRVRREQVEQLAPIRGAMEHGRIDILIGRHHLREFYNNVMPRLKEAVTVVEYGTDLIAPYLPPEPSFVFYFDIEDGNVLCRPDVHYGLQVHTVLDLLPDQPWSAPPASYRDTEQEGRVLDLLLRYIPTLFAELRVLIIEHDDEERIFQLLAYGLGEMMDFGEVRMTDAFRRLGLRRHTKFSVGVSVESNLMDLQILSEDLSEEELLAIFYQYQKKRKFVRLKNGDFLQLDKNETIERLLEIMETMGVPLKDFVRGKMQVPAYRALYLDKMLEQMQDVYTDRDRRFKTLIKEFKTVEDADYEVPASLHGILRKYQVAGYRWLRTLDHYGFGGILADEMGLGKTLQVIAVFLADKQAREAGAAAAAEPDITNASTVRALDKTNVSTVRESDKINASTVQEPDKTTELTVRALDKTTASTVAELPDKTASTALRTAAAITGLQAAAGKKRGRQKKNAAAVSETARLIETTAPAEIPATSLVICPASLVYNWGEELRRFAPELRAALVAGTKSERTRVIADYRSYDVLVTSYDLLKRDINEYEGKRFRFEVIDEAQYIKNHGTAAAKSVKLVSAQTRFALTGTPIENRLSELWSIFDYLMPGFLYTYSHFQADFEQPIVKFQDETASERLRRMASPFILRRRKEDVLRDLPEKLEEVRYAGMDSKQKKLYDGQVVRMKKSVQGQTAADFRKGRIQILAELTKIRQICCDPSLILANYDGGSAKRETCMDLIRTCIEGEHKALVFSQFAAMLELLEEDLKKEKIDYFKITGATPKERRMEMVKAFNSDRTPVFLISLKAGGTGLNLTGADVVIHYDPWWNIAAQNQATDRAHRIGQTRIVTVYKLIVKDTIEERILDMQEAKRKLAEDILSDDSIASSAISREDLLELLG